MPQAEEISDGCLDAGIGFTIPIHAQEDFAELVFIVRPHGTPDMFDAACASDFGNVTGLTGREFPPIAVAAIWIVTGLAKPPNTRAQQRQSSERTDSENHDLSFHACELNALNEITLGKEEYHNHGHHAEHGCGHEPVVIDGTVLIFEEVQAH